MLEKLLLSSVLILFYAFWRRWFGGGFKDTWLGNKRGVQCIIYLIVTAVVMYVLIHIKVSELVRFVVTGFFTVYTYCQFWARGHGACFDIGRDSNPTEVTINRYNERWYHIPCDILLKNHKYGFVYDLLYMTLRYGMPMVFVYLLGILPKLFGMTQVFSYHIMTIGFLIGPIYAICWTLSEKESWIFKKYCSVVGATNLAEYLSGAIWGLWPLFLMW